MNNIIVSYSNAFGMGSSKRNSLSINYRSMISKPLSLSPTEQQRTAASSIIFTQRWQSFLIHHNLLNVCCNSNVSLMFDSLGQKILNKDHRIVQST